VSGAPSLRRLLERRLLLAWLIFGAVLAVLSPIFWLYTAASGLNGLDFVGFYTSARVYLEHGSPAVFDLETLTATQRQIAAAWGGQPFLPDLYPPYWVLAQAWLGWLPLLPAYIAWGVLTIAATAVSLLLLALSAPEVDRKWAMVVGAGFLPVTVNLVQGQADAFVLLGAALALWLWRAGHEGWAGAALGLVLVKPQLAFLLVALPFLHLSRAAVTGLVAVAVVLAGVSLAVFGTGGLASWWHLVNGVGLASTAGTFYRPWLSLRGLLVAAGLPLSLQYGALVVLGLALLAAMARRPRELRTDFAVAIAGGLLLTPHSNYHDLSLLVVPGILLVQADGGRALVGAAYAAATAAVWWPPLAILAILAMLQGGFAAEARSRPSSRRAPL
jgi:alpha-1,2-mannosyltransferase